MWFIYSSTVGGSRCLEVVSRTSARRLSGRTVASRAQDRSVLDERLLAFGLSKDLSLWCRVTRLGGGRRDAVELSYQPERQLESASKGAQPREQHKTHAVTVHLSFVVTVTLR